MAAVKLTYHTKEKIAVSKAEWLEKFKDTAKPTFMYQVRKRLKEGVASGISEEQFDVAFEQLMDLVGSSSYHADIWFATMACIESGSLLFAQTEGKCPHPDPLTT